LITSFFSVLPPDRGSCESESALSVVSRDLTILHINIDHFSIRSAELEGRISLLPFFPSLLFLNETKLDCRCQFPILSGYTVISRKDRNSNGGGVLVFALDSLKDLFSPLPVSPAAEILWMLFHSQMGPVLLSCWYRPPCYGEVESINTFAYEWNSYSSLAIGTVVVGDLNLHNKKWLYFSRNTSPEGLRMQQWCSERGFRERVQKPTRGPNLLDLVLTDMPDHVSTVVLPELADHRLVMVSLSLPPLSLPSSSRACWKYAQANWRGLKRFFRSTDWQFLYGLSSDGAVRALTKYILTAMHTFIPRVVVQNASSHPWLNADCVEHIRRKTETAGTSDFPLAVRAYSRAF